MSEIESKFVLLSKLNWVGVILTLWPNIEPILGNYLPPTAASNVIRAMGLLIIILRTFFTSQPVTLTPKT